MVAAALLATLALALASSSPSSAALSPPALATTTADVHRKLLDFGAAGSAADAGRVVAGLVDHAGDAVDDIVSALMEDIGGSQDSATTASPAPQSTFTPAITTAPTATSTTPTTAPTPTVSQAPTSAPSASGSADETGVDASADGSSDGGPELEDNVLPATPTKVPTKESFTAPATTPPAATAATDTPTSAPSNEENVVAPVTPAPAVTSTTAPAATVATAAPAAAVDQSTKSSNAPAVVADKPVSGVGQVHAPTYSGSLAKAVSGVGKNATEPETPQPTKKQQAKKQQQASSSGAADGQTVDTSNTSSGNMYDMGTSSILSIVGVIVGICAIVALFVVINRKNYGGADSSDDELPVAYGYRIDGGSVVRLSPTFLHNGESSMVGSRVAGHSNDQERTSSSGESGEEKMPYFGSSFGFDNYLAQSHMVKSHLMLSGSGGGGAVGSAGARGSALLASDLKMSIFSSEVSAESESWSSVMESEQDTMSRCTRDTSLSALTMPKHSDWDSSSRMTFGEDSSSNYRSTRTSSHVSSARDTVREDSVAYSSASMAESSASGFYSSSGRSTSYSEFTRSTGAGSSIYSVSSP